jgi:TRAP-type mannitol/chloroaromatic compound transport system substrate-binding protein
MLGALRISGRLCSIALAMSLATSTAAAQDDPVRWRMNSVLHPKLFGEAGVRFAQTVERLSGGTFIIEVHDRLVLDQNVFAALESGLIDAVWGSAGHHHREDPALTIFTGFPFGPDPAKFTAWMLTGGGAEALDAIYARHRLKGIYCGVLPSEGGGWFVAPIETLDDLKGMNMRSFGYGARVLRKLGVVTYELPAGDIRPALEAGMIDGAEFSLPSIDAELGIAEIARHLYFPGWQQPVTALEILMPEKSWAALSAQHKSALRTACGESLSWTPANAAMQQVETIAAFRSDGVEVHAWSDEILDALRQAWDEVIAEDVARDPLLAETWAGYLRFREAYEDWETRAYEN